MCVCPDFMAVYIFCNLWRRMHTPDCKQCLLIGNGSAKEEEGGDGCIFAS